MILVICIINIESPPTNELFIELFLHGSTMSSSSGIEYGSRCAPLLASLGLRSFQSTSSKNVVTIVILSPRDRFRMKQRKNCKKKS